MQGGVTLKGHPPLKKWGVMFTGTVATAKENELGFTPHVLVVDDDPSVREAIVDYLGDNQVRVTALESGQEIPAVMERETIDLLVLDVRMPGQDGMQIARKLREESQVPIILLTGRKDEA